MGKTKNVDFKSEFIKKNGIPEGGKFLFAQEVTKDGKKGIELTANMDGHMAMQLVRVLDNHYPGLALAVTVLNK